MFRNIFKEKSLFWKIILCKFVSRKLTFLCLSIEFFFIFLYRLLLSKIFSISFQVGFIISF